MQSVNISLKEIISSLEKLANEGIDVTSELSEVEKIIKANNELDPIRKDNISGLKDIPTEILTNLTDNDIDEIIHIINPNIQQKDVDHWRELIQSKVSNELRYR